MKISKKEYNALWNVYLVALTVLYYAKQGQFVCIDSLAEKIRQYETIFREKAKNA